jgi:hypothetical protein
MSNDLTDSREKSWATPSDVIGWFVLGMDNKMVPATVLYIWIFGNMCAQARTCS